MITTPLNNPLDTQVLLTPYQQRVNEYLNLSLPSKEDRQPLVQAMHYAVFAGGKRLRPALVYLTGQCLGASLDHLDIAASAIECIHTYSLIHDDLPAMDDADLRRGHPTCHKAFDEATAILAGDALLTLAFELLTKQTLSNTAISAMIATVARASGVSGMVGGQALDLAAENSLITLSQLETIHRLKTAALINASVMLGAYAAECEDETVVGFLNQFGTHLGLAFQIRDDILDVEGKAATLGKEPGQDKAANKSTYPSILGLEQSKTVLAKHVQTALQALENLPYDTTHLQAIACSMVERES